jgi:hypothetical protein
VPSNEFTRQKNARAISVLNVTFSQRNETIFYFLLLKSTSHVDDHHHHHAIIPRSSVCAVPGGSAAQTRAARIPQAVHRAPGAFAPAARAARMRLLAHVAFFDAGDAAAAAAAAKAKQAAAHRPKLADTGKSKMSPFWRSFTFNAVVNLLNEMETGYTMFERVDAVIDVNSLNAFQQQLSVWTPPGRADAQRRVFVHVDVHHNLSHPFRTTWAHRKHVAAHLEAYDWFLYTEADVFVPAVAMRAQIEIAIPLFETRQRPLGFTRMVNNSFGELFFSDVRKPVERSTIFTEPGLGTFGSPDNSYAATWAYPQRIMRHFMQSRDWLPVLRTTQGMREKAGTGWRSGRVVVRLDDVTALRVFHVGKSGVFYARHNRGFNTLPAERLTPV